MSRSPSEFQNRIRALARIYGKIASWGSDPEAVRRIMAAVNPCAELAVIGEAPGPLTLRLSGVNYFGVQGRIGATGRYLDQILEPLGFTVYPAKKVTLASGYPIEPRAARGRQTAYCTDLCPVFPGHVLQGGKKTVRRPPQELIISALDASFLALELEVVQPKVILLLGSCAYHSFCTRLLKATELPSLRATMENLGRATYRYGTAVVVPFFHPSPASPMFARWFKPFRDAPRKNAFVKVVRRYLQ